MLDPFGEEAKRIVREFGGIEALLERIPRYVGIDIVLERVKQWEGEIPERILNMTPHEDVMSFYALLGALAFSPYGAEMELVKRTNARIYRERIKRSGEITGISIPLKKIGKGEIPDRDRVILEKPRHEEITEEEREKLKLKYKMSLPSFLRLWEGSLKSVYIRKGNAYLREEQALELWEKAFERNLERSVNLLYELRDELPPYYSELHEKLGEIARKYFKERIGGFSGEAQPLRFELFPPCIKNALAGVPAGLRNYAITVLLTSFLSYARICPNPPRKDVRIKDCISDLSVIEKEILPIIIEAGNRCKPPLFEDQPHEIKNIWYHLGFGLTDKPRLEDSGNSTWYFPPNCDKIRANAPQLCKPDSHCRPIKNPLTYYLRRLYIESRKAGGGGDNE
ncbi:MAG: primase large subunit [Thermococcaceae archaeon]|nr:primase large subunit [Thermococcaceae archaeon]